MFSRVGMTAGDLLFVYIIYFGEIFMTDLYCLRSDVCNPWLKIRQALVAPSFIQVVCLSVYVSNYLAGAVYPLDIS